MGLAIYGYGSSVLKKRTLTIDKTYPNLDKLVADMWETMGDASGCGLAAPQIGRSISLFIVDSRLIYLGLSEKQRKLYFSPGDEGIREVFINAQINSYSEEEWEEVEGCLSVPTLSGKVIRPWAIRVTYENQYFEKKEKEFTGMTARIIAHEYDHIQGLLYVNRLKPLGKQLMEAKLHQLANGKVRVAYEMKFGNPKRNK
ncbi:peptide deformylase [Sphingobacterium sp. lm-10]|uniref:peptide deformylase n=1 Tax=Sphingobacterium sp. lm-10 TaxID=2944904 RepID=UPI0020223B57|nr:peptide deformylase [Sphingobacterium sp. lm-10]MCL7986638.1 peptide deformylase [Sphingobacterium sp. lm-10]